ncbi:MAG: hypothetical protein A2402_03480 [Candidatus Staskawiczbacteria bacterium RIFOXYC1_FULL_37_43]|nr:MAG: hypothetical protein A2813_02570 [Candidatus Staskawiczbacteria bacterium RIFCSPHIGHO2_01_FULL_37_17]OGZ71813.1 MAG: hypothetical protein A2891_01805 [Candidatus Staskawiczbacteria bacterium RIFCSPLOWO2_01_FULL_37_19]OGZ75703.1 MAG: hypothetical protein A2205_02395 [Candidatus Staskawiczbacteria bacterium RIFOXYA1_FULL_37_15]OGZ77245.1 MAG: hypothetical protein A2280_02405 [Candidatus Staskawiczbacteria bacterium RIFOXYA12_FULL_37_10]OGZ80594.1 MAG: hypothetical protein A2353_00080 [Can
MNIIFKILIILAVIALGAGVFVFCFFFVGKTKEAENITWGVDFSQMQAEALKLNWRNSYLAILEDLGVKNIKIHTQWDWVEGKKDVYYFKNTDWQIDQAESHGAKIIFVLGLKSGRWPECHMPSWISSMPEEQQKLEVLEYVKEVVLRYKDSDTIEYWQVENEPLFKFGKCPEWYYDNEDFLRQEVALVKSLDPSRQIIISDSGEQSNWFRTANIADVVGITMYRVVWAHVTNNFGFNFDSFLSPITYWRKAQLIKNIFGKKVICIELQAEPWTSEPFYNVPLSEQEKTMDLTSFKKNIQYAKETGLDTFYFWGVEWWYWLKTTQNQPEIWNEARNLF